MKYERDANYHASRMVTNVQNSKNKTVCALHDSKCMEWIAFWNNASFSLLVCLACCLFRSFVRLFVSRHDWRHKKITNENRALEARLGVNAGRQITRIQTKCNWKWGGVRERANKKIRKHATYAIAILNVWNHKIFIQQPKPAKPTWNDSILGNKTDFVFIWCIIRWKTNNLTQPNQPLETFGCCICIWIFSI